MSQKEYNRLHKMFNKSNVWFMNHGILPVDSVVKDHFDTFVNQANFYRFMLNGQDISGLNVLDIGCGRGGGLSVYHKLYDSPNLFGCDINSTAIAFARENLPQEVSLKECSSTELAYEDNFFDVVVNLESSHLYEEPHKFLDEVFRVLKPGGKFYYADVGDVTDVIKEHESGLTIESFTDITEEVEASCKEDIDNFNQLDASPNTRKFFVNLATSKYEVYKNKENRYFYCVAEKPNVV